MTDPDLIIVKEPVTQVVVSAPGPQGPPGPTGATSIDYQRSDNASLFGAKCDARTNYDSAASPAFDGSITTGTTALSSTRAAFTAADIGKVVVVVGAGNAGAAAAGRKLLISTISSVTSGVATLANAATATVTNAEVVCGTDDTAALLACIAARKSVYLPSSSIFSAYLRADRGFYGSGKARCTLYGINAACGLQCGPDIPGVPINGGGLVGIAYDGLGIAGKGFHENVTYAESAAALVKRINGDGWLWLGQNANHHSCISADNAGAGFVYDNGCGSGEFNGCHSIFNTVANLHSRQTVAYIAPLFTVPQENIWRGGILEHSGSITFGTRGGIAGRPVLHEAGFENVFDGASLVTADRDTPAVLLKPNPTITSGPESLNGRLHIKGGPIVGVGGYASQAIETDAVSGGVAGSLSGAGAASDAAVILEDNPLVEGWANLFKSGSTTPIQQINCLLTQYNITTPSVVTVTNGTGAVLAQSLGGSGITFPNDIAVARNLFVGAGGQSIGTVGGDGALGPSNGRWRFPVQGADVAAPAAGNAVEYYKTVSSRAKKFIRDSTGIKQVLDVGDIDDIMPWRVFVLAIEPPATQTGFSTKLNLSSTWLAEYLQSAGAVNNEVGFDVSLAAGTWDITLLHSKGASYGIYTVSLDGSPVGTIDAYNAANIGNITTTISGVSVASAGKKRLLLKMAAKNASASAYYGVFYAVLLRRTA